MILDSTVGVINCFIMLKFLDYLFEKKGLHVI